ncbi:hypothetical protein BSP239C_02262 [Brevibacterium sp. 239c]|nr:hypothetical protein BSP239C_02262 [Brevibacterium sp. 239c]
MIPLIITATIIPAAVWAAVALEPHVESWATRRWLEEAHRASGGTSNTDNPKPEPHATSPNVGAETEPHQPRVRTGKSPEGEDKLRP